MQKYIVMNCNGFFYGSVEAISERAAMEFVAMEICEYSAEEAAELIEEGFFLAEQVA